MYLVYPIYNVRKQYDQSILPVPIIVVSDNIYRMLMKIILIINRVFIIILLTRTLFAIAFISVVAYTLIPTTQHIAGSMFVTIMVTRFTSIRNGS